MLPAKINQHLFERRVILVIFTCTEGVYLIKRVYNEFIAKQMMYKKNKDLLSSLET